MAVDEVARRALLKVRLRQRETMAYMRTLEKEMERLSAALVGVQTTLDPEEE